MEWVRIGGCVGFLFVLVTIMEPALDIGLACFSLREGRKGPLGEALDKGLMCQ